MLVLKKEPIRMMVSYLMLRRENPTLYKYKVLTSKMKFRECIHELIR